MDWRLLLLIMEKNGFFNGSGKALMTMKASFRNVANVLLDWDDAHNSDFCSWRGVLCDNNSVSVVSLYVGFMFLRIAVFVPSTVLVSL